MSRIFISHNSQDNPFAEKVKTHLEGLGHHSLFLDFDPQHGIPGGRNWEKELYANLRKCQVVIALCSENFVSSNWCFAEITHARALGKYLIPLRLDDCCLNSLLLDVQVIDARQDGEEAFRRLQKGLLAAGLAPAPIWDHTRPPYPGLASFQEEDAAIYFGRETETQKLLDVLTQFRRFGGPRLLLVLGASGSGKSSLVRAGLIPVLRRDQKSWIVIQPFRPLQDPFEGLSIAISSSFSKWQVDKPWKKIHALLTKDAKGKNSRGKALANLLKELTEASGAGEGTILLVVDQLEELLVQTGKSETDTPKEGAANTKSPKAGLHSLFVSYLRSFLDSAGSNFLCIGTLRSDFLGDFQESEAFTGYMFDSFLVQAITPEGLKQSITGPARVAGIERGKGLVEAIVQDVPNTEALPLLAFTLRELWEKHGQDGVIEVAEYRDQLGGLGGSIARAAEAVLKAHVAETGNGTLVLSTGKETVVQLPPEEEKHLRMAFMALVQVNEEGKYIRQLAKKEELPAATHDLLERFVQARLFTSFGDRLNGGEKKNRGSPRGYFSHLDPPGELAERKQGIPYLAQKIKHLKKGPQN